MNCPKRRPKIRASSSSIWGKLMAKKGRPSKPYRTSWGEQVIGLRKKGGNRWFIIEAGKEFREQDERRAVQRFKRWQSEQADASVELAARTPDPYTPYNQHGSGHLDSPPRRRTKRPTAVDEGAIWDYVREQLIERPEWVAERTGIAEVARLSDLPKPQPAPALKDLGDLYESHATGSPKHVRKVVTAWRDFEKWLSNREVKTLKTLTPAHVADYGDQLRMRGDLGPKTLKHKFSFIRSVLHFAQRRGINPNSLRHALDCCAVLQAPKGGNGRNPSPISRDDYAALLSHARDPRMRAMLLVMLNLCMYPSEGLSLDWNEINFDKKTVVTDRSKTSVVRIGVLWDSTLEAIETLRPMSCTNEVPVFVSANGTRWHGDTFRRHFGRLRAKAGVNDSVKAEHLRDGAYTAAVESGADLNLAKLLAGHETGISDYYVRRRPAMVAKVVAAIEHAYFS